MDTIHKSMTDKNLKNAPTEPGWDLYRSFLAVLQAGSLSAAARELGLAQPTLGRHIDSLEQALGASLFVRSQHGYLPTAHAEQLRPFAAAMAATASALMRAASSDAQEARGTVRITASEVVGCEVLPPMLTRLHQRYPELIIELALSDNTHDLLRREADIAVRMVRPVQDALVARRVGAIDLGLYAHRDYLARRGVPAGMHDIGRHALIGFDQETPFIRKMKQNWRDSGDGADRVGASGRGSSASDVTNDGKGFGSGSARNTQAGAERAAGRQLGREMFSLRTDNYLAQLAMVRAGFGIGFLQCGVARRDPALIPVLPEVPRISFDTWLAMHEDLRTSRRCSVVFDALAEELQAYVALQHSPPD
jgi:DNA-binding transcriptional LysR family regulator